MSGFRVVVGDGRTEIVLEANSFGTDVVAHIYNQNAHIGAVAIGDYDAQHRRASVSVHTRVGHKDDIVAQRAAYELSKCTERSACVIAGIHVDGITSEEIERIVANADSAVASLVAHLRERGEEALR